MDITKLLLLGGIGAGAYWFLTKTDDTPVSKKSEEETKQTKATEEIVKASGGPTIKTFDFNTLKTEGAKHFKTPSGTLATIDQWNWLYGTIKGVNPPNTSYDWDRSLVFAPDAYWNFLKDRNLVNNGLAGLGEFVCQL